MNIFKIVNIFFVFWVKTDFCVWSVFCLLFSFTIAGSAIGVTHNKFKKWHSVFIENLSTSIKLHRIEKLIVINHTDCGAAKIANGKKEFTSINENKIHMS